MFCPPHLFFAITIWSIIILTLLILILTTSFSDNYYRLIDGVIIQHRCSQWVQTPYAIYTGSLGDIIQRYGSKYHLRVDDYQI